MLDIRTPGPPTPLFILTAIPLLTFLPPLPIFELGDDLDPGLQHLKFKPFELLLDNFSKCNILTPQNLNLLLQRVQNGIVHLLHLHKQILLGLQFGIGNPLLNITLIELLNHLLQFVILLSQLLILNLIMLRRFLKTLNRRKRNRAVQRCVQPIEIAKKMRYLILEI